MASRIRILSEQLANQIAAGEVVERPASVVKELVENALDAGAGRIVVQTRAGGKSLIQVTDDGAGMNRDDLLLALERHATSKIQHADDLFAISTMGFRGEAVPAIASVSKMKIASREKDALSGYEVYAEGGEVLSANEAGLPQGTSVEVRSLFFNTPARRKFLKSASVELSHVADVVTRTALPLGDVYFELVDSGNTILRVPASPDPVGRIAALLGKDVARSLIPVSGQFDHFELTGFAGSPEILRSNARQIFFFVNGRYVRDRLVFGALRRAYEGHIPKGRHPVTILMLSIDPEYVDVNVHPAKLEIRFRKGPKVYDGIVSAVGSALMERFGTARPKSVFDPLPAGAFGDRHPARSGARWDYHPEQPPSETSRATPDIQVKDQPAHPPQRNLWPTTQLHRTTRLSEVVQPEADPPQAGPFSSLEIVGQLLASYIVCQSNRQPGSLVLIDQHAAHERILFEKLSADYYNSAVSVQALLLPVTLELPHSDSAVLQKIAPELKKAGVEVEPFGSGTFRIVALPAVVSEGQGTQLVFDCIERARETGRARAERLADDLLELVACHSAVRAGQALSVQMMREILRGLDRCDMPGSCPHGRPTTKEIPLEDIERFFGRR